MVRTVRPYRSQVGTGQVAATQVGKSRIAYVGEGVGVLLPPLIPGINALPQNPQVMRVCPRLNRLTQ